MTNTRRLPSRTILARLVLPVAAAAMLAACAPSFEARVARFSSLPTAPARTFYVEPANPAYVGGLEFASYANLVRREMLANGFSEGATPAGSDVTVMLDYAVGPPRERIQSRPSLNGGWGWGGGGWGGGGWGGGGWGGAGWGGGGWGWNPYWGGGGWGGGGWGGGWNQTEIYSVTEFTTTMAVKMVRNADKVPLFEGRADTTSRSNNLPALMPSLVRSMFTRFPGTNGETVRVRFNPSDPASPSSVSAVR